MDAATQVWMVHGAAFGASILTSLGALGVASFSAKRQVQRDHREDERRLRDDRATRLREDYVRVIVAANAVESVSRRGGEGMAEALMDLEEDELLRLQVVQLLRWLQADA